MDRAKTWRGMLLALGTLSWMPHAGAQLAAPPTSASAPNADLFQLAWTRSEGAEDCPSEGMLIERVKARLERDPFSVTAPRIIEGNVSRTDNRWHAELRILTATGGVLGRRDLDATGPDCTTLAEGALLAIVLTIDPNARLTVDEAHVASFPVPPPSPPAPPPPTPKLPAPAAPNVAPAPACPRARQSPWVSAFAAGQTCEYDGTHFACRDIVLSCQ